MSIINRLLKNPLIVTPEINSEQALKHVSRKLSGYCFRVSNLLIFLDVPSLILDSA